MKRVVKVFLALLAFFTFGLVGCTDGSSSSSSSSTSSPSVSSSSTSTKTQDELDLEALEAVTFENKEVTYDGNEHVLEVESLPDGVEATYTTNKGTDAGTYKAKVVLTKGTQSVIKEATLKINKAKPVITAELNQTLINYGELKPVATVNGDSVLIYTWYKNGKQLSNQNVHTTGDYTVKITAKATKNYQIPKAVEVNVKVVDSLYGLDFVSQTVVCDGTPKKIELTGEIPSNVTVEYTDNEGTEAGKYYATAKVKDSTGKVIETHAAVLNIVNPKNELFDDFLDEYFVWNLEGDQYSVNLFMENPQNFGLEHYDASWYTYNIVGSIEEALAHDKALFEEQLKILETFKDEPLSPEQLVSYASIEQSLLNQIEWYSIENVLYLENYYIDQFGGYVADFNSCMEDYVARKEQDVVDIIDFIESTSEAFPSYLVYLEEKTEAGYGLSDTTINGMKGYLDDILEEDEYYLVEILRQKFNGLSFLTDAEKEAYIAEMKQAVNTHLVPAIKELNDGLDEYLGTLKKSEEGYLTIYEEGLKLYELKLADLLGYKEFDLEEYIKVVDEAFLETYNISNGATSIAGRTFKDIDKFLEANPICDGTPDEMVAFLKEFAKTIVPELENDPEVVVKNMDDAIAKVNTAVAYYRKSALDNTGAEYITLNPVLLADKSVNEVLGTMAHEGYPGHLYAYCYAKETDLHPFSIISTSTAHGEGWATYVEFQLYEYAKTIHSDIDNYDIAMDYLIGNHVSSYMLEARIDLEIGRAHV